MISQQKTRVQAIKSKFENLNVEQPLIKKKNYHQLNKHDQNECTTETECNTNCDKENSNTFNHVFEENVTDASSGQIPQPNPSYLYNKNDVKRTLSETKKALTRQTSDPGKKLHRSHAFRCDRSQKIVSPQRHGSCNGRSETSDFSLKMGDKKLSKDRLKRLGNLLEDQMRKENFVPLKNNEVIVGEVRDVTNSIPDSDVPQHILDQYAKVIKPKKKDEKQDAMTDSGVSSETENLDDEKTGRIKKLMTQFEKSDEIELKNPLANLAVNDLCISSETIKLERKNPHLTLTDTLKKALKQPLPPGPPPKKPPRVFASSPISESPEKQKKDTKKMLEKLEQVLQKREAQKTEYDIAETNSTIKKPKEIHYLCTEILDITQRTLLLNQNIGNCFKSLNCAIVPNHSTLSLPYTRLSTGSNISSLKNSCSCSNEGLDNESKRISSFLAENKCSKCQENTEKLGFQCHLNCKCKKSKFFVDEHIYDVPFEVCDGASKGRSKYGTLNHSKSLEDLRTSEIRSEDQKIYDIPCDISRPETPVAPESRSSSPKSPQTPDTPEMLPSSPKSLPKSDFEKLRRNFENGFKDDIKSVPEEDTETKIDTKKIYTEKPPMKPKPIFVKKVSKSTENLTDDTKIKNGEKKFGTDTKRYRKVKSDITSGIRLSLAKRNSTQLDVDRENLNRLMNEIYETVTAACNMEDNKPASFPTDQSDGSEDSVKLTRSLTEKRKNYVRRVSSRVAYLDPKNIKTSRFRHQTSICSYKSEILDNPYSTFRSWKCFRASQNNLTRDKMDLNQTDLSMATDLDSTDSIDNQSIDEKTGCVDIELPFVPREKGLFNVCLLVGLNYMTGQAYVKNVFPSQVQVPPHIENLIFPETLSSASKGEWSAEAKGAQCYSLVLTDERGERAYGSASKGEWSAEAKGAQCYSLVLTDERGERAYGYCRRVLPEGATTCLPLCYCLIGKYRAPGFYYKVLQEIESRHGSSDVEIHSILQQLFETDFPNPGEDITITYSNKLTENSISDKCKTMPDMRRSVSDNSGVFDKSGVCDRSGISDRSGVDRSGISDKSGVTDSDRCTDRVSEFYDVENNNSVRKVSLSLEGPRIKSLRRPIEPRVDEHNLSVLLDCLGAGLTIKVFGSLLLERKVLLLGDKLSLVSSCMEALQAVLYPFVWQQPLISTIPSEIQRDVLEAPLPILAGMLKTGDFDSSGVVFEEGMLIDLTSPSKVIFYQGDESTILPTSSYKTLKTSLQMEAKQRQDDAKTRNLMISEAFLRFFVDILGDFWKYFSLGELKEGGFGKGDVVFDKESFIKNTSTKQNQYCLEWFTETAMFNHFIQNMAVTHKRGNLPKDPAQSPHTMELVDTPLPDFYDLFEERVRSRKANGNQKCVESKSNYKNAMNKKVRLLKTKLRELVA